MAAYARCGGIFNHQFTTNSRRNLSVKKFFVNRLILDRIIAMNFWPHFLAHPVVLKKSKLHRCRCTDQFIVFAMWRLGAPLHPSITFIGPTRVCPSGISISSVDFAGLTGVPDTYRHKDHATTFVAIARI